MGSLEHRRKAGLGSVTAMGIFFQAEFPKLCGFGWAGNTKLPCNILVFPFISTNETRKPKRE